MTKPVTIGVYRNKRSLMCPGVVPLITRRSDDRRRLSKVRESIMCLDSGLRCQRSQKVVSEWTRGSPFIKVQRRQTLRALPQPNEDRARADELRLDLTQLDNTIFG